MCCDEQPRREDEDVNYAPDREFMYTVEYDYEYNCEFIREFDKDGTEHPFTSIDKDKVFFLNLVGNGHKFTINTHTGWFWLNNPCRWISIFIHQRDDFGNIIITPLMERKDETYKDIIQYKGFQTDMINASDTGNLKVNTTSYHIGWKKKITIGVNKTIHVTCILYIDLYKKELGMDIKLTPNFNLNGDIEIRVKSREENYNRTISGKVITEENVSVPVKCIFQCR